MEYAPLEKKPVKRLQQPVVPKALPPQPSETPKFQGYGGGQYGKGYAFLDPYANVEPISAPPPVSAAPLWIKPGSEALKYRGYGGGEYGKGFAFLDPYAKAKPDSEQTPEASAHPAETLLAFRAAPVPAEAPVALPPVRVQPGTGAPAGRPGMSPTYTRPTTPAPVENPDTVINSYKNYQKFIQTVKTEFGSSLPSAALTMPGGFLNEVRSQWGEISPKFFIKAGDPAPHIDPPNARQMLQVWEAAWQTWAKDSAQLNPEQRKGYNQAYKQYLQIKQDLKARAAQEAKANQPKPSSTTTRPTQPKAKTSKAKATAPTVHPPTPAEIQQELKRTKALSAEAKALNASSDREIKQTDELFAQSNKQLAKTGEQINQTDKEIAQTNKEIAQFEANERALQQRQAASQQLSAKKEKLNRFSQGFVHSEKFVKSFEQQQLTPQQRDAVQKEVSARYQKLSSLAQQADSPFKKAQSAAIQQQIRQQILYERFVPARDIYNFAQKFAGGYTPNKMQAVRGYFDQVFEGSYPKQLPPDRRLAIEAEADRQYKQETGQAKANRNSSLWKNYRNIETSERFPDLWGQFRSDLGQQQVKDAIGAPQPQVLTKPDGLPNLEQKQGDKTLPTLPIQPKKPDGQQGSFLPKPIPDVKPKPEGEPAKDDPAQAKPVTNKASDPSEVDPTTAKQDGATGKQKRSKPTASSVKKAVAATQKWGTDYRANYKKANGSIPAGSQIHHIAPRAVFNDSGLAQEWVKRGLTKLDYPENLQALPQTQNAYDKSGIKIQHSGSHERWSRHARGVFGDAQEDLKERYGSLDKVPDDVMKKTKDKVMQQLREDLLDKDLGLEKGWVVPKDSGMDKLSNAQLTDQIG